MVEDQRCLFETGANTGPPAGDFRNAVRRALNQRFGGRSVRAVFSERARRYGHLPENAGFYEPRQLIDSTLVILLLPGPRSLGVNTWETAIACESDPATHKAKHQAKLIFVVPRSIFDYIYAAFRAHVADPAYFSFPGAEPLLGPANSFAARWVYLNTLDRHSGTSHAAIPRLHLPLLWYDDAQSWNLQSAHASQVIGKILNEVDVRLPS